MRLISMKKYSRCYLIYALFPLLYITHICAGNGSSSPVLLYTTTSDIRLLNTTKNKLKPIVIAPNVSEGMLDFHFSLKKLCWTDHTDVTIQCGDFDGYTITNKEIIIDDTPTPQGLACDWYTDKLYWTDRDSFRIEVASMVKPYYRKVLYWTDIDQPRAIAVVPSKGLLFWTDWGEVAKIERAGMDGDQDSRRVIATENVYWPNGLTVDYDNEIIYWTDGNLLKIERMGFNGENRMIIKTNLYYPYAITNFYNKLYWTDWQNSCIYMLNGTEMKELLKSEIVPSGILTWSADVQKRQPNPCDHNNGDCSHLCLLSSSNPAGYRCACPYGVKLMNETTCEDGPKQMLVLARRTSICIVYLDSPEYTYKPLNVNNVNYAIGIDYDPVKNYIYWTDDDIKKVQKIKLDGTGQSDVISHEILHPDGVAVDFVARNLYWADTGLDRIEVTTLDGKHRKIIISNGLFEPRAIAVSPELGWMFWSDWSEKEPKIERANLDGTERVMIISTNLLWPNGIALDTEKTRIYWCDAKTHKIEYSNMDGRNRIVLLDNDLPHPFGFTLMENYLYWTDWHRRSIERVHKDTGASRVAIVDQISDVMGLKAIRIGNVSASNPCGENNGNCSHFCLYRHNRTFVCACPIEYNLDKDGRTCYVPEVYIFYTANNTIGRVDIDSGDEISLPIKNIKTASSIDFDYNNNRIYWTDSKQKSVLRAYINGSDPQKVIELGLLSPNGIAVDWVALNLYWSDSSTHRIEVSRLTGFSRKVLLWRNVDEPYSVALDPQRGYMYWTEWGTSRCIKKAAMDGTNPRNLIGNVGNAVGLVVDYQTRRLYWTETTTSAVMSSDFNGSDRRTVFGHGTGRPHGIAVYDSFIYWSNPISGEIWKSSKLTNNAAPVLKLSEPVMDIAIFHRSNQRTFNNCGVNNGGCSHLCLASPSQNDIESVLYTCACPTHYTKTNGSCYPPKDFIIYSQKNLAVRLLPDKNDCTEGVLPIHGLKTVKAVDFDPVKQQLYWIEGKSSSIKRVDATGGNVQEFVKGSSEIEPYDLAVDAIGRLLFWTCATKDVINITRLNNNSLVGIIQKKGEKPRLIIVHPIKRLLFYTDVNEKATQLIKTRLDGSHRLVITKTEEISSIAIDIETDLIVWAQRNNIYYSNIDGENPQILLSESKSRIISLTVHEGWLYWLDRGINQLQRKKLNDGQSRSIVLNHASHILDMVSITQPDLSHHCASPKRCSHLCIMNGTQPVCACPPNLTLKEDDKRTCIEVPGCSSEHFQCANAEQGCIPINWRCDKLKDCSDGSDELNCPVCADDQYKCNNHQCISQKQVCDGMIDCKDGSDEDFCCKQNQHQCAKTNVCIAISMLCDGVEQCADGTDELEHVCKDASRFISPQKSSSSVITFGVVTIVLFVFFVIGLFYFLRRKCNVSEAPLDQTEDLLNPMHQHNSHKNAKLRKTMPDVVGMSIINGSQISTYDRNNLTGASSSTNGSSIGCYPRETLNPPPSPATTGASTRASNSREMRRSHDRPHYSRHYRVINQPPPPTPCSTDVCDESDYNYPVVRSRCDGGSFPPPPTPRSHCQSESCPPSPSSRSSTYFSPLPPPPSPVASPMKGYDS